MASDTEIANLALSHVGAGKEIASLTEKSDAAEACNRFFTTARDEMLRAVPWPFATKTAAFGLIESSPNTEWLYSYRYPSDCIFIRRILSGIRNDTRQSRIPYKIGVDNTGKLIFSDEQNAVAQYTKRVTDTALYPSDFTMALSLLLASYIAPRLTAGDPFKMGDRSLKLYVASYGYARSNAFNEEQDDEEPDSELIRSRA